MTALYWVVDCLATLVECIGCCAFTGIFVEKKNVKKRILVDSTFFLSCGLSSSGHVSGSVSFSPVPVIATCTSSFSDSLVPTTVVIAIVCVPSV